MKGKELFRVREGAGNDRFRGKFNDACDLKLFAENHSFLVAILQ